MSGPAQTFGVSVFIDPMLAELGWPRSVISGSYALATFISGISMLAFGHFLDRFGARRIVPGLAFLFGAGCIGMSAVDSPLGMVVGFIALRLMGSAALCLSCTTVASLWFVRWRGRAMSVTVLGMALSNALMPTFLQTLVNAYGWRAAWFIAGVIVWVFLIVPTAVLLRDRPEAVGLHPDGIEPTAPDATRKRSAPIEHAWAFNQAVPSRTFWLLVVACLAPASVQTGIMFHQVSYFASVGLSAELSASVIGINALVFALVTPLVGGILGRVSERYVMIVGLLFLSSAVVWLMFTSSPLQAVLYGVVLGLSGGAFSTTNAVIWPAYYGRKNLGSIRGVSQAVLAVSAATGPLILSVPHDVVGSYVPGLWVMVALPLVGVVAALLAGPPKPPPDARRLGAPKRAEIGVNI